MQFFCFTVLFVNIVYCSGQSTLDVQIADLRERLDLLEGRNIESTKRNHKKQVVFRGQPEIGDVYVSGIRPTNSRTYYLSNMFDKNYTTIWHSEKAFGNFVKISFHKSEILKKIDIVRCMDTWCQQNATIRNFIQVRLRISFGHDVSL